MMSVLMYDVPRGGGHQNIWMVLRGCGAVFVGIWIRVVVCHTPYSTGGGGQQRLAYIYAATTSSSPV